MFVPPYYFSEILKQNSNLQGRGRVTQQATPDNVYASSTQFHASTASCLVHSMDNSSRQQL